MSINSNETMLFAFSDELYMCRVLENYLAWPPACIRNSACMLSGPGDLPCLRCLSAMVSSSYEKYLASSLSTFWARHRLVSSFDTCRVNSRSWFEKRPCCDGMELVVTGTFPVCNVDIPVSLFSVCHALGLECVKSIDDTVSFHLCRRFSSKTLSSEVAVDAYSVFSESICSFYGCSHSSSQHGI